MTPPSREPHSESCPRGQLPARRDGENMRPRTYLPLVVSVCYLVGCRSADAPPIPVPELAVLSAGTNPLNQLSALFEVRASHADSLRITYSTSDARPDTTPAFRLNSSVRSLALLGLRPSTRYSASFAIYGPGGQSTLGPFEITSGVLPAALANVKLTVTGTPTGGYLLTALPIAASAVALVAFDSAGDVRWYRFFDVAGTGNDAEQQQNGDFTMFLGTTRGFDDTRGNFVQVTPTGEIVRTFVAPEPLYTDGHELLLSFRDSTLAASTFFGYDRRTMTVAGPSGPIDEILGVHTIVRLRPDGSEAWRFPVDQLLSLNDWIEPPPTTGDIDHPNSLTVDSAGNYVVSFRNAGEITSIDSSTGRVLWRLGGTHNEFEFVGDPLGGFSAQHYVRVLPNGHLLLFDNGWRHQPQESRAVEYALDVKNRRATMVWQFHHSPPFFCAFVGSAQRLKNGNTLIGWGYVGVVSEVDSHGNTIWEGTLTSPATASFYRMLKLPSLYRYEIP